MKSLITNIKDLAIQHPNINQVGVGDVFDLNNLRAATYPIFWIEFISSELQGDDISHVLRLYYIDRIVDDKSDITDKQVDASYILHDIAGAIAGAYVIEFSNAVTGFVQNFADMCAGGYIEVKITICPQTAGIAQIPIGEPNALDALYVVYNGQTLADILAGLPSQYLEDIIAGDNIDIDKTNPKKPIISATGGGTINLDDTVTETSANGVKSSGIWAFVMGIYNYFQGIFDFSKEPTGFFEPENVIVTGDLINRTITLTGAVLARWRGRVVPELVNGWVSPPHTETPTGNLFLYYDGTDFVWTQTYWGFDVLMIAIAFYSPVDNAIIFYQREQHGTMPHECHKSDHINTGTYYISGGDISNIVLNSTTAANRRPTISALTIQDEDIPTTLPTQLSTEKKTIFDLGGNDFYLTTYFSDDIIYLDGNQPLVNVYEPINGWDLTPLQSPNYTYIFVIGIPVTLDSDSQKYRYVFITPQHQGTLAAMRAIQPSDLNLLNFTALEPEFYFFAKFVIRYQANNWFVVEYNNIYGSRAAQVSSPAGNWLTSVSTDGTITGNGTVINPLATTKEIITGLKLADSPEFANTQITTLDSVTNSGVIPDVEATYLGATAKSVLSYIKELLGKLYALSVDLATNYQRGVDTCEVVNDYTVPAGGLATVTFTHTDANVAYSFKKIEVILTSTTAFAPDGSALRLSVNGIANNNYRYSTTTQSYYAITATHAGGGLGIYSEVVAAPHTMSFMARSTRNSTGTTIASITIYGYILPQEIDTSKITQFVIATGGGDNLPEGTRIIIKALK